MTTSMWDPFADLRRARRQQADDDEAQALAAATVDHGDPEPDTDQGKRAIEAPAPPNMNDLVRRAVGAGVRPGREKRPPTIGD